MGERLTVVGPDVTSAWPDWKIETKPGFVTFDCKACRVNQRKPTIYLCSMPLSNGAKAVLRNHTKTHDPDYSPEIRRVE